MLMQSLGINFVQFFSTIAKFLFIEGTLSARLYMHSALRYPWYVVIS